MKSATVEADNDTTIMLKVGRALYNPFCVKKIKMEVLNFCEFNKFNTKVQIQGNSWSPNLSNVQLHHIIQIHRNQPLGSPGYSKTKLGNINGPNGAGCQDLPPWYIAELDSLQ